MSAIQEKLKQLKDQENRLRLDQRKIEFLQHILKSAETYDDKDFNEVKSSVTEMLQGFVRAATTAIEQGSELKIPVTSSAVTPAESKVEIKNTVPAAQPKPQSPKTESELGPNDKLTFALQHRHLGGKKVQVNRKDGDPLKGTVVGLDAPFVHVAIPDGPTIKVPIGEIELT